MKIKKLVMFIFSYALLSEFVLLVLFFSLGLVLQGLALKFHDYLDLVLYATTRVSYWRFFLQPP